MKKLGMAMVVAAVAGLVLFGSSKTSVGQDKKVVGYVGAKKCILCHEEMDDSVKQWQKSKQANAMDALKSKEAKEHSKDPENDPKCLKCHTTGFENGGYSLDLHPKKRAKHEGVTCEACHGPGENYVEVMVKADEEKKYGEEVVNAAIAKGLIQKPDEKVCKSCHNEESPTFKKFDGKKLLEDAKHGEKLKK